MPIETSADSASFARETLSWRRRASPGFHLRKCLAPLAAGPEQFRHVALIGEAGGIRTLEPREGPPAFKSDGSHASGTHSHAAPLFPTLRAKLKRYNFRHFGRFVGSLQL